MNTPWRIDVCEWARRFWSEALFSLFVAILCSSIVPDLRAADRSREGSSGGIMSGTKPEFLDRLIAQEWDRAGIKPSRPATDEEFLRRVYLDLLGRIPSISEARGFLQTKEVNKREKLVEYLLNHPDFARNFANIWTVLLIGRN